MNGAKRLGLRLSVLPLFEKAKRSEWRTHEPAEKRQNSQPQSKTLRAVLTDTFDPTSPIEAKISCFLGPFLQC